MPAAGCRRRVHTRMRRLDRANRRGDFSAPPLDDQHQEMLDALTIALATLSDRPVRLTVRNEDRVHISYSKCIKHLLVLTTLVVN